jgi:hypothetical protein
MCVSRCYGSTPFSAHTILSTTPKEWFPTMKKTFSTKPNPPVIWVMRATPSELVPRELQEEGEGKVVMGLVDWRGEEYNPKRHEREDDDSGSRDTCQSFLGER